MPQTENKNVLHRRKERFVVTDFSFHKSRSGTIFFPLFLKIQIVLQPESLIESPTLRERFVGWGRGRSYTAPTKVRNLACPGNTKFNEMFLFLSQNVR